jgi:transcriptional regulator with XRE-family HTH domain
MPSHERPADRGTRRGRELLASLARELHLARVDRGLALGDVGTATGLSRSQVSRVERGLVTGTSIVQWSALCEVVGLELAVRAYAGGSPIRDRAHAALLGAFRRAIHPSWRWAAEVPLPRPGDPRAWDAMITLHPIRYGVEAESGPRDSQALVRRLQLKQRDGEVDGVILVLPRSRLSREFVAAGAATLDGAFPVTGGRALELLRAGIDPGGSAMVLIDPVRPGAGQRPSAR